VFGGDVAANGSATGGVAGLWRGDGYDEDLAGDLGDHQPVGRWYSGVEERVRSPDVIDVVDAQCGVLEEVGGLVVDLEGCLVIEGIEIEQ
jgi:hypothetical protein